MDTSRQKDYLWNTAAGVINAAEAVVMSMIVTRYGHLADAGILSLAFASGNVLMTIGKYGGRIYQVTDARKQFSFRMYMIQRLCSLVLMAVSLTAYIMIAHYDDRKAHCIILIAYIYMIEALEDCFWGMLQAEDRLYAGAQMFTSRWIVILSLFLTGMIITNDIVLSLLFGATGGSVVFIIWMWLLRKRNMGADLIRSKAVSKAPSWLLDLFRQTTPLFIAGFCSIFISNIPKFSIDRYMDDEIQACYGFVAMPVFVIGLLNQFIYQPTVVRLTIEYNDGDIQKFRYDVRRQTMAVTLIAVLCICGAWIIGVPVLSVIYHTDLSGFRCELVILQIAGGFLAMSGYFSVLLTLMRRQKLILYGYLFAVAVGIVILNYAVKIWGTIGASIGYLCVIIMLFGYYFVIYQRVIRQKAG
ncbi:MAG: lipopolysaccharide biosynthesis protein [Lachnospiraceae bacterium]|nr:lipopolysaccharide biosynthesis protein [Lachnospiraceae bacterium]